MVREDDLLKEAIQDESLLAVTNGLYIKEIYLDLCLDAFILKYTKGRGLLVRTFPEHYMASNSYQG